MSVGGRLMHAWNALTSGNRETLQATGQSGLSYIRPYGQRLGIVNDKSIVSSIYTRVAIDVSSVPIQHVKVDPDGRYVETVKSKINNCLTVEANIDQAAEAFIQDIVMTMFDHGHAAIVPIDTTLDPNSTGSFDIETMRVGTVVEWKPRMVRVEVYNDQPNSGKREQVWMDKSLVAIVVNPLYNVMNEPNSTLQRLIRKLSLLDSIDEAAGSGKLDIIIQLPYVVKSETRKQQAEQRRSDMEQQLQNSKYGVAYADATEKITQLNRPAENNMLAQIEMLTGMLYSQLGLTTAVFDGTADEKTMINYYNRTISPILKAITQEMARKFLTKTARTQGHSIRFYRDPFTNVTLSDMAEIADKFTRNAIASSNDIRTAVGWKPSTDAKADELSNKNMPETAGPTPAPKTSAGEGDPQNGST